MLLLLYPYALGIMGPWGKRPVTLFLLLVLSVATVGVVYFTLHAHPSHWSQVAASLGKASSIWRVYTHASSYYY
jgi:hypothetical protein